LTSSTVVEDVQDLRKVGLATVTFFYFDFRDKAKQDTRSLLSSLLTQLCVQSDSYCGVLSALHSEHDRGLRQPSEDVLLQCLKEMLELRGQGSLYIIIDGLDECPNTSGWTSPREEVLKIMQELIELHLPYLHLSVTSRPEADIQAVLGPLSTHSMSLHDETGQAQDIATYVKSVVLSHRTMREWPDDVKELVTNTLERNGGGM
jgi:NACHT domain